MEKLTEAAGKATAEAAGSGYFVPAEQAMESVGRLAGGLAHDFNNILGAIEGYATLAQKALPPGDQGREDMAEIRKAVEAAAVLTRQLLAFSRKQVISKAPCRTGEFLAKMLGTARGLAGGKITVAADFAPDLPDIMADPVHLETALLNLLLNARDAMAEGGTLTLGAAAVSLDRAGVNSPDQAAAGSLFLRVSVADTGCGMAPEVLEHIFEPYFTTRDKGRGRGLGLSVAYGNIRQHNGWVEARSQPGRGSEFTVFLPAAGPRSAQPEALPDSLLARLQKLNKT
ncbi:MAG TPA: ATP-binding protein [Elusimicrobiales bacterium]|nr:ATP-binding protein [Elusimicrobiales bacterium]